MLRPVFTRVNVDLQCKLEMSWRWYWQLDAIQYVTFSAILSNVPFSKPPSPTFHNLFPLTMLKASDYRTQS